MFAIEECALPLTTIMALRQLVKLGTRCTITAFIDIGHKRFLDLPFFDCPDLRESCSFKWLDFEEENYRVLLFYKINRCPSGSIKVFV